MRISMPARIRRYGSEPPFDEDEGFDPVAEKHIERPEAVEDAAERLAVEVGKLETEAKRAVAAQILAEKKRRLGENTEAELADATRLAWERCENLARQRNPDDLNLDRLFTPRCIKSCEFIGTTIL